MRNSIQDFSLANPIYVGATVTAWTVSAGVKTATKATLYAGATGTATLANPQSLDSDGKFQQPVYVDQSVVVTVSGLSIADHDTGIINSVLAADSVADVLADLASTDSGEGASLVGYFTTGETVTVALNARLPEIANYAALRAYAGALTAVYVRGVANIFDGGHGVFRVDAADTTSADNGGTILVDAMGRRWKREFSHFISVLWFGAKADRVTPDSAAITAACAAAAAHGIEDVYLGKEHLLDATVVSPVGVVVKGQGRNCKLEPSASGTFTEGFCWLINSTDGLTATTTLPNAMTGALESVVFWNESQTAGRKGVRGFGSFKANNLRGRYMTQMVSRPTGLYSDQIEVDDVYCEPVMGTDAQVDIRGLGDGIKIARLHFPYNAVNPGNGTPNGLRVAGSFAGTVEGCVGGDVFVTQSKLSIVDCHYERAVVTVDGANVDFRSTYLSAKDRIPLVLANNSGHEMTVSLDGVEFAYLAGLLDWQGSDIQIATGVNLEVRNSYRRYSKTGSLDKSQMLGLKIENASAAALTEWNKYSYAYSRSGRIYRGNVIHSDFSIPCGSASFNGLTGAVADSTETWGIASATYYYQAQYVMDSGRIVGRNSVGSEQSVALTGAGSGARITVDFSTKPASGMLRLYRGTSTGSYDQSVDILVYSARLFYDSGTAVNGVPWIARGAGAVDTLNGLGESHFELKAGRAVIAGASIPTVGAWAVADEVYRTAPAAAGKRAWVCTTAGTPGTWKPWGAIDA